MKSSDVLVDPLKLRTYGVKKGFEEKEQKIKDLHDHHKRYYPTNNRGLSHSLCWAINNLRFRRYRRVGRRYQKAV